MQSRNGWTPERRERQRRAIRQWQPWKHSTGPRTADGKARASRNAFKGGHRAMFRMIAQALRNQRDGLAEL